MPRRISLGGPGTLITEDPNPLEVALKQAQLEELLQKPQTERAQLALAQQQEGRLRDTAASARQFETFKGELAKQQAIEAGDIDRAKLIEEQTRTKDTRAFQQGSLAEESKYHTGVLGEQKATREQTGELGREATKASLARDIMSTYAQGESGGIYPKGGVAEVLAESGFPQLKVGMERAHEAAAQSKAAQALGEMQGLTPEQRTAAITELPDRTRKALIGLMNQPKPGQTGPPIEGATMPVATATPTPVVSENASPFQGSPPFSVNLPKLLGIKPKPPRRPGEYRRPY